MPIHPDWRCAWVAEWSVSSVLSPLSLLSLFSPLSSLEELASPFLPFLGIIKIPNKNSNNKLLILRSSHGQTRHWYCLFG